MGTATDPYQHCEGRYRLTRGVVEALADFENPMSMLTKSTLIVRDVDVFQRLARVTDVSVAMSVGTLDEDVRRVVEPGTPPGGKRLEILRRFADAGIRTGVLVAPILPGLTDDGTTSTRCWRRAPRPASRSRRGSCSTSGPGSAITSCRG